MTTDDRIIRRSLDEPAVFGDLFERHGSSIFRYVARRVGREVAEDVMSETFLVAFHSRSRFDTGRTDARPWLYGIANNLVHRHFSAETRRFAAMENAPADHISPDAFERVADRLDAIAHVGVLGRALAALKPIDRDTLLLYAWGDLDYEGIAQATGTAIGTVKSRLNRARKQIRNTTTWSVAPRSQVETGKTMTGQASEDGATVWTS